MSFIARALLVNHAGVHFEVIPGDNPPNVELGKRYRVTVEDLDKPPAPVEEKKTKEKSK